MIRVCFELDRAVLLGHLDVVLSLLNSFDDLDVLEVIM